MNAKTDGWIKIRRMEMPKLKIKRTQTLMYHIQNKELTGKEMRI